MKDAFPVLSWVGLVLGLAALLVRDREKGKFDLRFALGIPLSVAVAALGATFFVVGDFHFGLVFLAAGALCGALLSVSCDRLGTSHMGALMAAFGLTSFILGTTVTTIDLHSMPRLGGLVCGLMVSSIPWFGKTSNRLAATIATLVFGLGVCFLLAAIGYKKEMPQGAALVAMAGLLAVAVGWSSSLAIRDKAWIGAALKPLAIAGLSWLAFAKYLGSGDLGILCVASVIGVLVTAWAVPKDGGQVAAWGLGAVIWLGLATFAFSKAFGLGMAVTAGVGIVTALTMSRSDLLPSIGLVAGLAAYRVFREGNPELIAAFDIAQHYAMVGLMLGVVVVVALADALGRRRATWGAGISPLILSLIAVTIVVGASAFFGTKGAVGLMIGLAVGPMVSQLTAARSPWAFSAAAALQSLAAIAYGPLTSDLALDRDGKLRLLVWLTAIGLLLYGALLFFARQKKERTDVVA